MSRALQSETISKVVTALASAQKQISHALKDAENPHFNSTFASLESVIDAGKGPLLENGIVIVQQPLVDGDARLLVTTLMHSSGEWIRSYTEILNEKKTAQSMGSGISYARRYGLLAMLGIGDIDDDDDGNAATAPQGNGSDERLAAEIQTAAKKFAQLGVSSKMIAEKFKVPSVDDLDFEQLKALNEIGYQITKMKKPKTDYFKTAK